MIAFNAFSSILLVAMTLESQIWAFQAFARALTLHVFPDRE
jgi:hypothetical protein